MPRVSNGLSILHLKSTNPNLCNNYSTEIKVCLHFFCLPWKMEYINISEMFSKVQNSKPLKVQWVCLCFFMYLKLNTGVKIHSKMLSTYLISHLWFFYTYDLYLLIRFCKKHRPRNSITLLKRKKKTPLASKKKNDATCLDWYLKCLCFMGCLK